MSDISQGHGWWQASDGKWYPPKERDDPPAQGWWLASDGKWYPPERKPATRSRTSGTGGRSKSRGRSEKDASPDPVEPAASNPPANKPAAEKKQTSAKKPSTAKKAAAKKPATTKASAKPASTDADPTTEAPPAPPPLARQRPNLTEGVNPLDQIRRRDVASKEDAQVLAPMRALAATRALVSLQAQIEADKAEAAREQRADAKASPANAKATPAKKSAPGASTDRPAAEAAEAAPAPSAPPAPAPADPLLEVKPSALSTDIEHIGERLAIFEDRVELRDRNDIVRRTIASDEIADVVVHRKLTGAVLSIESIDGADIVARGLRPDQAEDARDLIMRKTRPTRPVDRTNRPPAAKGPAKAAAVAPSSSPSEPDPKQGRSSGPRAKVNEGDLLRKLGDLHRAGVLTDEEFEAKIELVGRLVRGEDLSPSPT